MLDLDYLTEQCKFTYISDYATASTTDVTATAVDMAGYEGVVFVVKIGVAAANNILKAQQSADNSTFADLEGTGVTSGTSPSYEQLVLDILHPTDRYVRPYMTLDTSSAIDSILAIQYRHRDLPVENTVSGTMLCEQHHAPAEGTA